MPNTDFYSLRNQIKELLKDECIGFYQRVILGITYLSNVTLNDALDSLTNLTRSFIESCALVKEIKLKQKPEPTSFRLVLTKTGRIIVFQENLVPYVKSEFDEEIGYVTLEKGYYDIIVRLYHEKQQEDDYYFKFIDQTIHRWNKNSQLNRIIGELSDSITRFETVFI